MTKKARTTGATDVSEAIIGSMRMKDTASQGGVMGVEEKVQQKEISSEVRLEGYMAPYYAAAMIYGLSSFGTSFNGVMNHDTLSMQ
ncbi:hypothetical protein GH714_035182 [Hevea brasiliensis]|uniref:Uncharacterized protein n=1 Tax=Hevea brasiliensis TaxID=3981 RepID=A0A6A6M350_HEVBR|nr:hypothetical protein GH714_035182 [Hevea brasiliensis]